MLEFKLPNNDYKDNALLCQIESNKQLIKENIKTSDMVIALESKVADQDKEIAHLRQMNEELKYNAKLSAQKKKLFNLLTPTQRVKYVNWLAEQKK